MCVLGGGGGVCVLGGGGGLCVLGGGGWMSSRRRSSTSSSWMSTPCALGKNAFVGGCPNTSSYGVVLIVPWIVLLSWSVVVIIIIRFKYGSGLEHVHVLIR